VWSGRSDAQVFVGHSRVAWQSHGGDQRFETRNLQEALDRLRTAPLSRCTVWLDGDVAELRETPAIPGLSSRAEAEAAALAWLRDQGHSVGRAALLNWPPAGGRWALASVGADDWELLCAALGGKAVSIRPWWSLALGSKPGEPGHWVAVDAHGLHHLGLDAQGAVIAAATLRAMTDAGAIERWVQRQQAASGQAMAGLSRLDDTHPELPSAWRQVTYPSAGGSEPGGPFELLSRAPSRRRPPALLLLGVAALAAAGWFAQSAWIALGDAEVKVAQARAEQSALTSRSASNRRAETARISDQAAQAARLRGHTAGVLASLEGCHPDGAQTLQLQLDAQQGTAAVTVKGPAGSKAQDWLACLNHQGQGMDWRLVRVEADRDGSWLTSLSAAASSPRRDAARP
jgi:hypothetical protein